MTSNALRQGEEQWGTGKFFGSSAPQRMMFVVLISILVWTLAAALVMGLQSVRLLYPLSVLVYSFVAFHLMPWAVGLRNLRRVRMALQTGMIDPAAANLSYSIVLGMLTTTYVVLCSGEAMAALVYRLGALHLL